MIKNVTQELDSTEVDKLIDRLPFRQKLKLFKKLERETAAQRMKEIFKRIDERRKKNPISDKEIQHEIKAVREQLYGPRRR